MTRFAFLQSLCALLLAPFAPHKKETEIARLEEAYCRAANALWNYRQRTGFVPGVLVRAQYRDEPAKVGIIDDYGPGWRGVGHMDVPVRFGDGRRQPWPMSDLTLIYSPITGTSQPDQTGNPK